MEIPTSASKEMKIAISLEYFPTIVARISTKSLVKFPFPMEMKHRGARAKYEITKKS